MNDSTNILIALGLIVVLSYLFNQLSGIIRVPSVLLLLATGIGIGFAGREFDFTPPDTHLILELLGTTGLIFIVLEGSLDLHLSREKVPLVGRSLLSAFLILLFTSGIICYILIEMLGLPFRVAMVNAVPLGIVSSSIAIPSVTRLTGDKKEFIIYESTFSDILGIMLFNYVIQDNLTGAISVLVFFRDLGIILAVSAVSCVALLFLLNYTKSRVKFFLIFAVLVLVYSVGKLFHLPSLVLILIFGLMLNNAGLYIKGRLARYLHVERLAGVTRELKMITAETAFIIRTFFFILFGYSFNIFLLNDVDVLLTGSLIIVTIIVLRYIFLRFISKSNLFPELLIAPRGLITIVLFYSIPLQFTAKGFNEGIIFFVIIVSSLLMMLGLMLTKTHVEEKMGRFYSKEE